MSKTTQKINEEQIKKRNMLRKYLLRYRQAKNKIHELQIRLKNFLDDLNNPLGSQKMTKMPSANAPNAGAASYVYRQSEIEERIYTQQKEANKILLQIMDIFDLLPIESETRSILEMKYIEGYSDKKIMKEKYYASRSTVNEYCAKGLDELLKFKKVNCVLERYYRGDKK